MEIVFYIGFIVLNAAQGPEFIRDGEGPMTFQTPGGCYMAVQLALNEEKPFGEEEPFGFCSATMEVMEKRQ